MREYRTAAKLSQEELAALARINRTYLGDVERGERNVAIVNMHRIAAALRVPLSVIVRKSERLMDQ